MGCVAALRGRGLFDVKIPRSAEAGDAKVAPSSSDSGVSEVHSLASLPSKFNKLVWVGVGSYVVLNSTGSSGKVKYEIAHLLTGKQVSNLQKQGLWPFKEDVRRASNFTDGNPNHRRRVEEDSSSSDSDSDD